MMKNLSLSGKIGTGFAIVILLTVIVGLSGFYGLKNVVNETDLFKSLDQVKNEFSRAGQQSDQYFLNNHTEGRKDQAASAERVKMHLDTCKKEIDAVFSRHKLPQNIQALLEKVIGDIKKVNDSFEHFMRAEKSKQETSESLANVFKEVAVQAEFLEKIKAAAGLLKADCDGYYERNTQSKWETIVTRHQFFAGAMATWKKDAVSNAYMKKTYDAMETVFVKIFPLLDQYKTQVDHQLGFINAMNRSKTAVVENMTLIRDISFTTMEKVRKFSSTIILAAVAGSVGLGILFGYLAVFFIARPIGNVVFELKDIAEGEGDLTRRLEVKSKDETGQLANNFNLFIQRIQLLIKEVSNNAVHLDTSSGQLKTIAGNIAVTAEKTSGQTNTVATASEELSMNMNSVASAMEQASVNANAVKDATSEMTTTIEEIARNTATAKEITQKAVTHSGEASSQVEELGQAALQIGQVVETITDISSQVNLLALNATIEAARAGQAGKGFAVVANEIKELARQTADASSEIKSKVSSIQNTTNMTVQQISQIGSVVNEVNEIVAVIAAAVEEQSSTTSEIADNVSQVSIGIDEINKNVAQSNTAVADIAKEISQVSTSADDLSESSHRINDSSVALAGSAKTLNTLVDKFKF
jgi:methyl-accepting chemotaxis protein